MMRTFMLPLVWVSAREGPSIAKTAAVLSPLTDRLKMDLAQLPESDRKARDALFESYGAAARRAYSLGGVRASRLLGAPLVNASAFISFVWATRDLVQLREEEMVQGGDLWFVNLTVPDSSIALPTIAVSMTYLGMELAFRKSPAGSTGKWIQHWVQRIVILAMPFYVQLPQAVFMYWITSSAYGSAQSLLMASPSVRRVVGLPLLSLPPQRASK
ncbi:unnamed protein product [Chrysoparadoxa australica]